MAPKPTPDREMIRRSLETLFGPEDVIELRCFPRTKYGKQTDCGYFDPDHRDQLIEEAARRNAAGAAVYVALNPVNPQLLSRGGNMVEERVTVSTSDKDIVRRNWFFFDMDPVRPKDTSASDEQVAQSKAKALECYNHLKGKGWPDPIMCQSGNGWHLIYAIDLPNDEESTALVEYVLKSLAATLDTADVKVDTSVFNASRLTKLYGTVANKGVHNDLYPHRLSKMVSKNKRGATVTPEQMRALPPAPDPKNKPKESPQRPLQPPTGDSFDLEGFLARLGIEYTSGRHNGSDRYLLAHCPFNPEHVRGEAAVFRNADGVLGFRCMHNSCSDNHWQELRALVDGPKESRGGGSFGSLGTPPSHSGKNEGVKIEWTEPLDIPNNLLPVDPFDLDLLPGALRQWVADIADRMQCPPDFPAVAAMVALSSVIGRKACILPKRRDDWTVIPNLWGGLVGRPGMMKSPALAEATRPLDRLAAEARKKHTEASQGYELSKRLSDMASKADEKQAQALIAEKKYEAAKQLLLASQAELAAEVPVLRRYKVVNSTVEALGEVMLENPEGVFVYRDELYGLLRSLDKEGQEEARGFYLTGADGNQGYTFDRIMRGHRHIPAVCLSMLGGIQPARLMAYIRDAMTGGAGDDGLFQRLGMLVWPDMNGDWINVDRWPDTDARREAFDLFERMDAMKPCIDTETGESLPNEYRFAEEAQGIFNQWRQNLECELRSEKLHPAMESHLAKYRKLVPAIALLCALASGEKAVSADSLLRALAWSEYLRTHAERIYAVGTRPDTSGAKALLAKIRCKAVADGFRPADIYLKGWSLLGTPEDAYAAIRMLSDLNYLRRIETPAGVKGGRPSVTYQINPKSMKEPNS